MVVKGDHHTAPIFYLYYPTVFTAMLSKHHFLSKNLAARKSKIKGYILVPRGRLWHSYLWCCIVMSFKVWVFSLGEALYGIRRHSFNNASFDIFQHLYDNQDNNQRRRRRYKYNRVDGLGKRVPGGNIFNLKRLFLPINEGNVHWTLAVINMETKIIEYYDSLRHTHCGYLHDLFQYFQDKHKALFKTFIDVNRWQLVPCQTNLPL